MNNGILVAPTFVAMVNLRDVNDAAKADGKGLVWDAATSKHVYTGMVTGVSADVSAYEGLLRVSSGSMSAVTVTAFALTVLDDADAATMRATIGAASSAELTALSSAYNRRKKIIARVDNTAAPPTEVSGDRYLLDATGSSHANWDGAAANSIVEFDGSAWVETTPEEGWIVYNDDDDYDWLYVDDGSPGWEQRGGTSVAWGAITGTLSSQTDLQNALDAKGDIDDQAWTGDHDFSGADSLVVPHSGTPTIDAVGKIGLDTAVAEYTGMMTYHDGTEQMILLAVPVANLSTTDAYGVVYNAADNELKMQGVVTPYALNGDTLGGELSGDLLVYDTDHWENLRVGSENQVLTIVSGVPTWAASSGGSDSTIGNGESWTARSAAEANSWRGVAYGNGLFVAVSTSGTNRVMTSLDGINWTARSAAELNTWLDITYGNGLFVAVSEDGTNRVMTSPDGITWTARSAAEANAWTAITYGNGLFVAVANDGTNRVMTSPDGITWTARSAAEANGWQAVTYSHGLFVATSNSGTNRVMTSPDGITWTARSAAEANTWIDITYGNGLFVAVAHDGTNRVMTSPDGITWTARSAAEANAWKAVTYGNGLFVAASNSGTNRVMTSGKQQDRIVL